MEAGFGQETVRAPQAHYSRARRAVHRADMQFRNDVKTFFFFTLRIFSAFRCETLPLQIENQIMKLESELETETRTVIENERLQR